jgi:hypothetical protein
MPREVNVIAVIKPGTEKYLFRLYDETPATRAELNQVCGRYAADPDLKFTWYDAACVVQRSGGRSH